MVIIRRPRQFPPIPSNKEIIEKATTNNVIDLSKIRDIKFAIKSKVRERISKATKTKLRKKEIVDYFSKIYTKYMDGEYVFRKNHFMSYRDKNGSISRLGRVHDSEILFKGAYMLLGPFTYFNARLYVIYKIYQMKKLGKIPRWEELESEEIFDKITE